MARIYTRIVIDMLTGAMLEAEWEEYDGPWMMLKESAAEKTQRSQINAMNLKLASDYSNIDLPFQRQMAQSQFDLYGKQAAQEMELKNQALAMEKSQFDTEQQMMKSELARQHGIQDPIIAKMTPYITSDIGYDPATMKAMSDAGMTDVSRGYDSANAQLKASLAARGSGGGDLPVGGDFIRGTAELGSGMADQIANLRRGLLINNSNLALQNRFNAAGVLMGNAGMAGQNVNVGSGGSLGASGQFAGTGSNYATNPIVGLPGAPQSLSGFAPLPKPPGFFSGFFGNLLGTGIKSGISSGLGMIPGLFKRGGSGASPYTTSYMAQYGM